MCGYPRTLFALIIPIGLAVWAPFAMAAENDAPRDPHLAAWWNFDDTSGKTALDSSGNGRNGTLKGGLSFEECAVPGKVGKALKFGGGEEHIEVTGYKGVTGSQARTVAAWIKTSSAKGEILSWGTDDVGAMWTFRFFRSGVGVTPKGGYLYGAAKLNDDAWHHVAVVIQEADQPNLHDDVSLFTDGKPAEIHDIGLLDLYPIDTGGGLDVRIGQNFNGLIDDVRIYDRALSKKEIKALAELPKN